MTLGIFLAAVILGTWNGNWFPSGRAEHRAHPDVEEATIRATGRMLRSGIDRLDPAGTNDIVLCLNEIRGPKVAERLVAAIGRTNLAVAVVTGYRRRDRFDQQQDVILTTLKVTEANWSYWKSEKKVRPPRGYAHAELVFSPAVTAAVYCVHLKANYGANTEAKREDNRRKRWLAVEQLLDMAKKREAKGRPFVIAGDFNADRWRKEYAAEAPLFEALDAAGFVDALAALPAAERGTHPSKTWGASALDHLYLRGFGEFGGTFVLPSEELSDHWAVFTLLP